MNNVLRDSQVDIDRDSHEAVYLQLARHLIAQTELAKPGDRFPTEEELIEKFELSRTTVRRAVQMVVDQGLVIRQQGKGTFVTGSRPVQSATKLVPFVESFTRAGIKPTVHLREFTWLQMPEGLPSDIRSKSSSFLFASRLYESENTPLAVAEIYLPREIGAQLSLSDIEQHPVYQVLQQRLGKELRQAQLRVTMQQPSEEIAELLGVAEGLYVPRLDRITEDRYGEFLECTITHIHPDAFELRADVAAELPPDISYTFNASEPS